MDGWMDGRTDMKNSLICFRGFEKATKKPEREGGGNNSKGLFSFSLGGFQYGFDWFLAYLTTVFSTTYVRCP
jgi:hypothetical protein